MNQAMNEVTIAPIQQALTEFEKVGAGLLGLTTQYKDVVFNVQTGKGMDEAKAARLAIREPRYAVGRALTAAKKELSSIKKNVEERAEQITTALLAIEEPIDAQIKAEEVRKDEEKKAKEAAEQLRVAALRERIAAIVSTPTSVAGGSADAILQALNALAAIGIDASFDEFIAHAADAKEQAVSTLITLHAKAVAAEEAQSVIAAQRAELERFRAEIEAQRAELALHKAKPAPVPEPVPAPVPAPVPEPKPAPAPRTEPRPAALAAPASQPALIQVETVKAPVVEYIEMFDIDQQPSDIEIVWAVADRFSVGTEQALQWICNLNVDAINKAIAEAA